MNWSDTPINKIIKRPVAQKFIDAGYKTAGDIINTSTFKLAVDVKHVGIHRAEKIRQEVFNELLEMVWNDESLEFVEQPVQEPTQQIAGWKFFLIGVLFAVLLAVLLQTVAKAI